jgi:hypothetical protein
MLRVLRARVRARHVRVYRMHACTHGGGGDGA